MKTTVNNHDNSHQLRILVADDQKATLLLYKTVLSYKNKGIQHLSGAQKSTGKQVRPSIPDVLLLPFDVASCRQGDEVVDTVKNALKEQRPFAIAFLDIHMPPGPDGIWTAEQIRKLDPGIEIVMMTGFSDINPSDIARRVPPVHKLLYLQKPFHPEEIAHFATALGAKWQMERDLREIHQELERRIEERTKELSLVNKQLKEDIAKREKAEARLRQMEKAFETMQPGVIITDLDGKIMYSNLAGARMHGYQVKELLGEDMVLLTPPAFQKPSSLQQIAG